MEKIKMHVAVYQHFDSRGGTVALMSYTPFTLDKLNEVHKEYVVNHLGFREDDPQALNFIMDDFAGVSELFLPVPLLRNLQSHDHGIDLEWDEEDPHIVLMEAVFNHDIPEEDDEASYVPGYRLEAIPAERDENDELRPIAEPSHIGPTHRTTVAGVVHPNWSDDAFSFMLKIRDVERGIR